tara:strand:- start:10426 stop:11427 length:1002 start_codon:yes stop_codon:yes gene_type:complete
MSNVYIHDAGDSQNGFAFDKLKEFVQICTPDVIFIYNDPYVCYQYLQVLEFYDCKKMVYLDLVYNHMNPVLINYITEQVSQIFVFDQKVKTNYKFQNAMILQHGLGNVTIISKETACAAINIDPKNFYVLNLNRNQPRKRYDIFIKSVVRFYAKFGIQNNVKFILGTQIKGAFDLLAIFANECTKHNVSLSFTEVFIVVENPQALNDTDIGNIYNAADIGINTCDGEGWGLCNFEHMAYGKPQILPNHDCFLNYANEKNSQLIEPQWSYYVDNTRDANGGEAFVVNPEDVCDAVYKYFSDNELYINHAKCAMSDVAGFEWTKIVQPLSECLFE